MRKAIVILVIMLSGSAFVSAMNRLSEIRRRVQHYNAMIEHHAAGQYLGISKDLDVELEKIKQEDKLREKEKKAQEEKDNSNLPLARY